MINKGKHSILGINVHAVDYDYAVSQIVESAKADKSLGVSALAVHGVMEGYADDHHRRRLNGFDMIVPDGQPVRWALGWLHGQHLDDRVYGPELTLRTLAACAEQGVPVFFYGSTPDVLDKLIPNIQERFSGIKITGYEPSKFKRLDATEKKEVIERIKASGAQVTFVGLGCPRQEVWVHEYKDSLNMPLLAVGAAFDFYAGTLEQAPKWMQDRGLEWFFRLTREPGRLWKRYLKLNPAYLFGIARQRLGLLKADPIFPNGAEPVESYG